MDELQKLLENAGIQESAEADDFIANFHTQLDDLVGEFGTDAQHMSSEDTKRVLYAMQKILNQAALDIYQWG